MYRGKVTKVDTKGVYVQTAEFGTLGPCQAVVANYAVGDMVLCDNVGDDGSPDLIVVGQLRSSSGIGIDSTAAGYLFVGSAGSGHAAAIQAHTGAAGATSTRRWWFGKQQAAETGSNAGSNFGIYAYDDSGSGLGYGLEINRATRRVTISNAATTAGIEMGSSGPTITTGTGAPSHSAPNGSVYLRTDGTATTTLYVRAAGAWTALS